MGYEQRVLEFSRDGLRQKRLLPVPLEVAWARLFAPWEAPPLRGRFGQVVAFPDDLEREIINGHGSVRDANELRSKPGLKHVSVSVAFLSRLVALRFALDGLSPRPRLSLAFTPSPESTTTQTTASERDAALGHILAVLKTSPEHEPEVLDVPMTYADADFATHAHLGTSGRSAFTAALARALLDGSRDPSREVKPLDHRP